MFFNILVESIFMYGDEIWRWKEREEIENLRVRHIKWNLGLDRCTLKTVVLEETKIEFLSIEARCRVIKYQEKSEEPRIGEKMGNGSNGRQSLRSDKPSEEEFQGLGRRREKGKCKGI